MSQKRFYTYTTLTVVVSVFMAYPMLFTQWQTEPPNVLQEIKKMFKTIKEPLLLQTPMFLEKRLIEIISENIVNHD